MKRILPLVLLAASMIQANPAKIVLTFDIDGEVNYGQKLTAPELCDLLCKMISEKENIDLSSNQELNQFVSNLNKNCNGYSNLLRKITDKIQELGLGDYRKYEFAIIEQATYPKPIPYMIQTMKELKQKGYTIIGATNHDIYQHMAYRKNMRDQGVDLNEVFDAVLAVRVNHEEPKEGEPYYKLYDNENLYIASDVQAFKPHKGFFDALWALCKQENPSAERMIFTDDRLPNVKGARALGIPAFHFFVPPGVTEETDRAQVITVVENWKQAIAQEVVN